MRTGITFCTVLIACGDDGLALHDAPGPMPEAVAIKTACTLATAMPTTQLLDESYGSDPMQRMDVERPTAGGPWPLVVLIHGGGWSAGTKADFRAQLTAIAALGYTTASLEYRLAAAPSNTFPTAVQDVRCALRTLRSRATTYHLDPAHVVAVGGSAGAHLAAMLGVASDVAGLDGTCAASGDVSVDGVVSLAGPMDLRDLSAYPAATQPILINFFDGEPTDDPAEAALASPITHVDANDPPFFFIHGTLDDVVPEQQSHDMQHALWRANVPATLFTGAFGHGTPAPSAADSTTIACTLDAFISAYTK